MPMKPSDTFDDDCESVEVTKEEVLNSIGEKTGGQKQLTFAQFCWSKGICRCILPLLGLAIIIAVVMKVLGIQPVKENIPFSDFIFSRDSWEGLQADDLPRWNTRGAGVLKLEMINALEDHWQPYFEKSIEEWNNGDPDVVELTVTQVTPDSNCEFIKGKFAICAGDYGDTSFHGVNEILVYGDTITASVAKLNEFYLAGITTTEARKQYTMCHEIGHGFGLPHSDENFFNMNLGNCMDYTDRPWTNTAPDTSTYQLLQKIYGTPSKADGTGAGTTSSSKETMVSSGADDPDSIPESIRQRANEAASNLASKFADSESNEDWVQLHRNDQTAAFQIELGEGYFLQAHFLLAYD